MLRPTSRPTMGLARFAIRASGTSARGYATQSDPLKKTLAKDDLQFGKQISDQRKLADTPSHVDRMMFLFPGTFIPTPFSKLPKTPLSAFLKYQYERVKAGLIDFAATFAVRWQSKPSVFAGPRAQIYRSNALAAGKALHARLGQAMADGDAGVLREIAMPRLQETLTSTLSRRNPRERTSWEILQNHSARVAAHRALSLPLPFPRHLVIEQAVVAIDSTQKLERFDKRTGEVVPGSARVQRKVEYVALHRSWDSRTYKQGKWALLGNAKETTPEEWAKHLAEEKSQQAATVSKKLKELKR